VRRADSWMGSVNFVALDETEYAIMPDRIYHRIQYRLVSGGIQLGVSRPRKGLGVHTTLYNNVGNVDIGSSFGG